MPRKNACGAWAGEKRHRRHLFAKEAGVMINFDKMQLSLSITQRVPLRQLPFPLQI